MITESDGVVLKQVKTVGGRRMIVLLTRRFGKISAGTSIDEKGKGRAALALRPFTHGKYQFNKVSDQYYLNSADTISSHYGIGGDVDKYMAASYVMEFTEKIAPEDMAAPELFLLLVDFLDIVEKRKKKFGILILAYILKALKVSGNAPQLGTCVLCGEKEDLHSFDIGAGGILCPKCRKATDSNEILIYDLEFDIVKVLRYLADQPLYKLERLALDDTVLEKLMGMMKAYLAYHLEIKGLKSEEFL